MGSSHWSNDTGIYQFMRLSAYSNLTQGAFRSTGQLVIQVLLLLILEGLFTTVEVVHKQTLED